MPEVDARILAGEKVVEGKLPGSWPKVETVPDVRLSAGDRVGSLEVVASPGHSPGHVTYAVRDEEAMFSGDVLFQGSVGRVDLPGGDGPTLLRSIQHLLDTLPPETGVYPGHMGVTTLGVERETNPFLAELVR